MHLSHALKRGGYVQILIFTSWILKKMYLIRLH
jgi:hypothetical protein